MRLKLSGMYRRTDSMTSGAPLQFLKRLPADVVKRAKGQPIIIDLPAMGTAEPMTVKTEVKDLIKFSLRTADPVAAASRTKDVLSHLDHVCAAVLSGPKPLTPRQRAGLSGEVYHLFMEIFHDDPKTADDWACMKGLNRAVREGRITAAPTLDPHRSDDVRVAREWFGIDLTLGIDERLPTLTPDQRAMEQRFGMLATLVLTRHGLNVDDASRKLLLSDIERTSTLAALDLKRHARADYTPSPVAASFPKFESGKVTPHYKITAALDAWWIEAQRTGCAKATFVSYRSTIENFVRFLGVDDIGRVTPEDVVRFKDYRLASTNPKTGKPISAKTVSDSDLTALKSLFSWAVANRKIRTNPATGITIKLQKQVRTRGKSLTDDEAKALLLLASGQERGNRKQKTFDAVRWVPWVMCYTGARVGEITQLRKQDVQKRGDFWVIEITPEAGTVKDKDARVVVLHEHLVEMGFPAFAMTAAAGHLFLQPGRDGDVLGPLQGVVNRITEAARSVVKDERVKPNHGWRQGYRI